ncbi:hypothetical protein BDEG_23875 [Batrachochytrium dendrobatidis JEL423]|uniref:protein-serine/threonine phosphatase n=1 Tax=Batrachochytrium dendrobatidis (strain JEL423) TaxID=403673 RepID=A0A177WJW1_BATDL|nr:hypothetical protein BDEG_23875 [Batrachochytrium dendrobatidis JEL423]
MAVNWQYEMRRDMQEIIPGLWLGPYSCARDNSLLHLKGITHILCVRESNEEMMVRMRFPEEFHYLCIQASDSPLQNLIPLFPKATSFIHTAITNGGSVLVHCNGGISRSPAFVVAYMMDMHDMQFAAAFQFVQSKRFCMNPIEVFKYQLREYEPIIMARRVSENEEFAQECGQARGSTRRRLEDEDTSIDLHIHSPRVRPSPI